jgi:hypothetical protein
MPELDGLAPLKARDELSHAEALAYWAERAAAKAELAAIEALPPSTTVHEHQDRTAAIEKLRDKLVDLDRRSPLPGEGPGEGPAALATPMLAIAFRGLNGWDEAAWKKRLGNRDKWLGKPVHPGGRGRLQPAYWDPVAVAVALVGFVGKRDPGHDQERLLRSIRAKFQTERLLDPWRERWKVIEAELFDPV